LSDRDWLKEELSRNQEEKEADAYLSDRDWLKEEHSQIQECDEPNEEYFEPLVKAISPPEDMCDHIFKLAKNGLTLAQIGITLRDSVGTPQVSNVTGSKILHILKTNGIAPDYPEDLFCSIKEVVSIHKHLDQHRKDNRHEE